MKITIVTGLLTERNVDVNSPSRPPRRGGGKAPPDLPEGEEIEMLKDWHVLHIIFNSPFGG